jgi:tetratricopeptide (TPR) repeat protein/serine phosphatase RsbU (regulator of sigma subunit)
MVSEKQFSFTFLRIIAIIFTLAFLNACNREKEKIREKPKQQVNLSKSISELINDTSSVSPLIDSLRKQFVYSEIEVQLNILGELAENWRPNTYNLAKEELDQSIKLHKTFSEGDAYCKFGIYYVRKFNFDSAHYYLQQAESVADKGNLHNIKAQAMSWNGEILRLSGEIDQSIELQDKAISMLDTSVDAKRIAFCNISKGESYRLKSEFNKAIECYNTAIKFATKINDANKISICYNSIGDLYRSQNNYPKALEFFNKGLELAKKNNNKMQLAFCYSCLGDIYTTQKESMKALKYYEDAYKIASSLKARLQECNSLSSMGLTYHMDKNESRALECFNKAIEIANEIGNKDKMAFCYSIVGDVYLSQKKYNEAIDAFNSAIKMAVETGNKNLASNTYYQLGSFYLTEKKYADAKSAAESAFKTAKESETPDNLKNAAKLLSNIYDAQNQSKLALDMLNLFILMKDSMSNEQNIKQFAAIEYKAKEAGLRAEQLAREETNKAQAAQKEEEIKRQKTIRYAFTIGFGLVLILVVVVFRNLQENKKKNKIITAQKIEVEHQKELVDEKNKEITDSITYAKRLQDAILPPLKMVREIFPESFVLYIPKDIIAGDFYWMEHSGDFTFIAAADSTGHGVPGAMVSVVCSNALNRSLKEFKLTEPGLVLDKARELVLETFAKSEGDVKDGMDISLLCINRKKKTLTWAGANNPLWFISNGDDKLSEIKANKQPIGKTDNPLPFTTHEIPYVEGTVIYLITDGYADQFGGAKGKKLKYKQLEEYLVANRNKPLDEQKSVLETNFIQWKSNYEQVDDVTILAVKI